MIVSEGNESFEKLASVSLISNMTTYLRTKYNMGGVFLVNVVSIWSGFTNITPLAGAYLADARLGRFLTLLFGSLAAFLVHLFFFSSSLSSYFLAIYRLFSCLVFAQILTLHCCINIGVKSQCECEC